MDRFINNENIRRYRQLASEATTEAQRSKLLALLAEEQAKLFDLHKTHSKPDLKSGLA
jgi:hypothetical protein